MIRVKFPNGLTDKEIDTDGMLSLSLTVRQALNHIERKTMADIVSTGVYCSILMWMMVRQYVQNRNGAVQYLKDMKHDQLGANVLADDGDISEDQLISISKQAFVTSGHKVSGITDINIKWAKEDSAHKSFIYSSGY